MRKSCRFLSAHMNQVNSSLSSEGVPLYGVVRRSKSFVLQHHILSWNRAIHYNNEWTQSRTRWCSSRTVFELPMYNHWGINMACHPRWSRLIILHRKYYILFSDKLNFHCRTNAAPPICRLQLIPLFLELMIGLSFYWLAGVTESSCLHLGVEISPQQM